MLDAPHFNSFWMAGFEGADHVNGLGEPLDMARSNGHMALLDVDYAAAARLGMRTVRESVGWRLCESADGRIDLSRVRRCMEAANRHGVQIVWSLMHYGMPDGVRIADADFAPRFARFAGAVASELKGLHEQPPIYNPVNEIGFLAWAVSQTGLLHAYANHGAENSRESGFAAKCQLVRASLMAMEAMRDADARARFLHVEPVVHVVAPLERPDLQDEAATIRAYQWQSWDLLAGRLCPELGGHARALDLIGVNHYASSQWEVGTEERVVWHLRDPRWLPLSSLVEETWVRYGRPMIIAETSHIGSGRAAWLHDIGQSVADSLRAGVDLRGVCLYPAVDRHDWADRQHWHHSGLWDVDATPDGAGRRRLHFGYARALRQWQRRIGL